MMSKYIRFSEIIGDDKDLLKLHLDGLQSVRHLLHGANSFSNLSTIDNHYYPAICCRTISNEQPRIQRPKSDHLVPILEYEQPRLNYNQPYHNVEATYLKPMEIKKEPQRRIPEKLPLSISSTSTAHAMKQSKSDQRRRIESWSYCLLNLLKDPIGYAVFSDFLGKEFSQENLKFWSDCEDYKNLKDVQEMKSVSQRIFLKYLHIKATDPVNVDHNVKKQIESNLANPSKEAFIVGQNQIYNLMKFDSYKRFLESSFYKKSLDSEENLNDIIKVLDNKTDQSDINSSPVVMKENALKSWCKRRAKASSLKKLSAKKRKRINDSPQKLILKEDVFRNLAQIFEEKKDQIQRLAPDHLYPNDKSMPFPRPPPLPPRNSHSTPPTRPLALSRLSNH